MNSKHETQAVTPESILTHRDLSAGAKIFYLGELAGKSQLSYDRDTLFALAEKHHVGLPVITRYIKQLASHGLVEIHRTRKPSGLLEKIIMVK